MVTDQILDLVSYRTHSQAHIQIVGPAACISCAHRACTFACPAACYVWNEARARVDFAYEACLECGTCLVVCDRAALDWNYPPGGFGVRFRLT
jgi:ferredoxin like protein